jgi:phenylpropionate dioxygenase-like ring-hydroxylating dioxygenase large terminal subunit
MHRPADAELSIKKVRPDLVHPQSYTSREVAELELKRLWPRVWQWACRLEEIPHVGNYMVYDIADQSIVVVRTGKDEIKAFHNVCPHRGRRLVSGAGQISKFHCMYHAWQWDLRGNNTRILDHEQWNGCPGMTTQDMSLVPVHVAQWGGFVYINMSDEPESFEDYIAPARRALDILKFDGMRIAWYNVIKLKANWKVAQEAFAESYHVLGTHPQFAQVIDEKNHSIVRGKHSTHTYEFDFMPGTPSRRLQKPPQTLEEWRENFAKYQESLIDQLGPHQGNGQGTARSFKAAAAAIRALPAGTPMMEVMTAATLAMKEAADKAGAFFPMPTAEQWAEIGGAWVAFPNQSFSIGPDGTLAFSGRPDPEDPFNPDRCEFHMMSLVHYGTEEPVPPLHKALIKDWREHNSRIPPLLCQDMINIEDVQKGLHSIALNRRGLRPNPVQERSVSHLHHLINSYIYT